MQDTMLFICSQCGNEVAQHITASKKEIVIKFFCEHCNEFVLINDIFTSKKETDYEVEITV